MAMVNDVANFTLLRDLPPENINTLVRMVKPVRYAAGEVIVKEGDSGKDLVFIVEGNIAVHGRDGLKTNFSMGSVIGVIPLLTQRPLPATGTTESPVKGYTLGKADFDRICELSPSFGAAMRQLAAERMEIAANLIAQRDAKTIEWLEDSQRALMTGAQFPNELDWKKAREEHKSAPLAIWLGILLDGIPESFVIGAGLLTLFQVHGSQAGSIGFAEIVPYTLIAGLFLSNFPEALASSANMRLQGFSKQRVFLL